MRTVRDNGGRRVGQDRRHRQVPIAFCERRSEKDRRNGEDRRSGRDRRSPKGLRRLIGADRRWAFRRESVFFFEESTLP
jgi:hypothetical protein